MKTTNIRFQEKNFDLNRDSEGPKFESRFRFKTFLLESDKGLDWILNPDILNALITDTSVIDIDIKLVYIQYNHPIN